MAPAEIIAAFEHTAICVGCRERMGGRDQLRNAFVALGPDVYEAAGESFHLAPEQIAAYVDDQIDVVDREIADSHLDLCAQCEAEVIGLREIKDAMSTSRSRHPVGITQSGRWSRLVAFWSPSARRIALQVAVATALLLICLMATLPLRQQVADLRAQLSELQQKNEALQDQVSSISDLRGDLASLRQSQAQLLDESARPAVALYDGGRLVTLDRQGNLGGLDSLSESSKQLVKTVLSTQRIRASASVSDLIRKPEVLMGSNDGNSFSVLSPVGAVLQNDRPTFRWTPLNGEGVYLVTVYDAASKAVATSPPVSGTEWTVPRPLKRGAVYTWEVTATKEDKQVVSPRPPAPQAKFKVVEQAMLDELDWASRAYPDAHLAFGVLFAQAGLFEDAERELNALVRDNPHSAVAQRLLTSLKSLRKR